MLVVCRERIAHKVKKFDYLMLNEMTLLTSVAFRYIVKGNPVERYWWFIAPENHYDGQTLIHLVI